MTQAKRHRKADRIFHQGATPVEIACDTATGPFDQAVRAASRKWGCDRLPELVSPETAARWGMALAKMNAAIDARDVDATTARVNVCIRGMAAMDAEATAGGHKPADPTVWHITVEGVPCGILSDADEWMAAAERSPGMRLYTLQEVANALEHYGNIVAVVKDTFPGATVTAIRKPTKRHNPDLDGGFIPF